MARSPRAVPHLAEPKLVADFEASDFEKSWPYVDADFARLDESLDWEFYAQPRFVTHIDDGAIGALTEYYRRTLPAGGDVLDLCSSWISHLPAEVEYGRVAGVGMNVRELEANRRLTDFEERDLNADPSLPYPDASFDAVLNVVSVDYMTRPRELFQEMHRVLRPGGVAAMSFSNRCFRTKAVRAWLDADDVGRMAIVGNYFFHSVPGGWADLRALDITPLRDEGLRMAKSQGGSAGGGFGGNLMLALLRGFASMDPMFVVEGRKAP